MMLQEAQNKTRPKAMPRIGSMARKPVKRTTSAETMMIRLQTKVGMMCQKAPLMFRFPFWRS